MRKQSSGFTMIELEMVIVVLGILALIAMPQFFNLSAPAKSASEDGIVGGVRAGIATYIAQNQNPPASLDAVASGADCSTGAGCFSTVLMDALKSADWSKNAGGGYVGPSGSVYTYTSGNGKFTKS